MGIFNINETILYVNVFLYEVIFGEVINLNNVENKKQRMTKVKKGIFLASAILLIIIVVCAIYLGDFYHADMEKINSFTCENEVKMQTDENDYLIFGPEDAKKGFIFYPGGKVEYTAYIPFMKTLASEGILCILVEMPFNLAVFDVDAADGIPEKYSQIEDWYIGGHSLGGSMAASYVSKNINLFEGLVLLGSYSTADLSETDIKVLSVYGSEDMVMNKEKYESNKKNLPSHFTEIIIDGGCHAYFGMYGEQDGDGTPKITNEKQIRLTVEAMKNSLFMK